MASLSLLKALIAANATAGAVFRPSGSSKIVPWLCDNCLTCSASKNLCSSLQINTGSLQFSGKRNKVSCSMLVSLTKGRNCLGKRARESGHKRVPLPPHIIVGKILTELIFLPLMRIYFVYDKR